MFNPNADVTSSGNSGLILFCNNSPSLIQNMNNLRVQVLRKYNTDWFPIVLVGTSDQGNSPTVGNLY